MAPMKLNDSRRVWRMTSDSPLGEYLELAPKRAYAPHADSREENRATPRAPAKPAEASTLQHNNGGPRPTAACNGTHSVDAATADRPKLKVLRPAQVENWQSSSFDLMSGLQVRDVSETIPGRVFDELFKTIPATVFTKRRC
jgi:hypothetical protein